MPGREEGRCEHACVPLPAPLPRTGQSQGELRVKSTNAGGKDPLGGTVSRVDGECPAPVFMSICVRGKVKGESELPGQVPFLTSWARKGRVS